MAVMGSDGGGGADEELDEVVGLELMLLDPSVRRSPERIALVLHPDFVEVGASGRIWSIDDLLQELRGESDNEQVADATEVSAVLLDSGVALVTYESHRADRVTLRSSVWVRVGPEWKLRYHQGTAKA